MLPLFYYYYWYFYFVTWALIAISLLSPFSNTFQIKQSSSPAAVNGGWSGWSIGRCSVTCGIGKRQRRRRCDNPPPSSYGLPCPGFDVVSETCRLTPCVEDGASGEVNAGGPSADWSPWSACSGSCGMGTRKRTRPCSPQATTCYDSQIESCRDDATIPPCPIDGAWTSWLTFLPCPTRNPEKVCQNPKKYHQVQMRFCSAPHPAYGGKDCEGPEFNYTSCAKLTASCIKAHWSPWLPGKCSVTCGTGIEKKSRTCIGMNGNNKCFGPLIQSEVCKMPPCPLTNGGWSNWREVQSCDPCEDLAENDVRVLRRKCDNPEPASGGRDCEGESEKLENCREFLKCPLSSLSTLITTTVPFFVPTSWTAWQLVGSCGVTCGNGHQRRVRVCIPERSETPCPGPSEEMIPCRMPECPTTEPGVTTEIAITTLSPEVQTTSSDSSEGSMTVTLADSSGEDRRDGDIGDSYFTAWSPWSPCDAKCKQTRKRTCRHKQGIGCQGGSTVETRNCKEDCLAEGVGALSSSHQGKNLSIALHLFALTSSILLAILLSL